MCVCGGQLTSGWRVCRTPLCVSGLFLTPPPLLLTQLNSDCFHENKGFVAAAPQTKGGHVSRNSPSHKSRRHAALSGLTLGAAEHHASAQTSLILSGTAVL